MFKYLPFLMQYNLFLCGDNALAKRAEVLLGSAAKIQAYTAPVLQLSGHADKWEDCLSSQQTSRKL